FERHLEIYGLWRLPLVEQEVARGRDGQLPLGAGQLRHVLLARGGDRLDRELGLAVLRAHVVWRVRRDLEPGPSVLVLLRVLGLLAEFAIFARDRLEDLDTGDIDGDESGGLGDIGGVDLQVARPGAADAPADLLLRGFHHELDLAARLVDREGGSRR